LIDEDLSNRQKDDLQVDRSMPSTNSPMATGDTQVTTSEQRSMYNCIAKHRKLHWSLKSSRGVGVGVGVGSHAGGFNQGDTRLVLGH
jgi:hypothetical protein